MKHRNFAIKIAVRVLVFYLLFSNKDVFSQSNCVPNIDTLDGQIVFSENVKLATFVNGEIELTKYIESNIKYPNAYPEFECRVLVTFIVDKNGKIRNESVCRVNNKAHIPIEFEDEALNIVRKMPNWIPGNKRKKKVYTRVWLKIEFKTGR